MKHALAALVFTFSVTTGLPAVATGLVLTAPREPSAGQPTTLIFQAPALGHDLDPGTQPVATISGTDIRIDLNAECNQVFCDVIEDAPFRVDLPALDEGDYQVEIFESAGEDDSRGSFVFSVGPATDTALVRPAEGAWSDQSRPGTGLYLQTRGPLLSVAQFDYLEDRPQWRLDVAPMRGDSALVLLRNFDDGSCFGCEPYAPPSTRLGGTPLLITFESARRARAELSDGTVVPMVSLPFGADYVPVTLADLPDEEFGSIPLPDLSGTWAVRGQVVTFGAALLDGPSVRFPPSEGSDLEILCIAYATGNTSCSVTDTVTIFGAPVPPFGIAPLGDVEENRIRMESNPEPGAPFYMVRIPSIDGPGQ